ncbi:hypothetical protein GGR56DRAFT_587581 [Xylariaceae sp. FL0804]|nr:hypothetical protein GGR56DRAFT_587581 [Xylariaceae sp. FL0804]
MPNPRAHLRTSRRISDLKDEEIDHEIGLVDRDDVTPAKDMRPPSLETNRTADPSTPVQPLFPADSRAPLTGPQDDEAEQAPDDEAVEAGPSSGQGAKGSSVDRAKSPSKGAELGGDEPSFNTSRGSKRFIKRLSRPPEKPETAIDVLYENQRGGFLCGIPLFSCAALGNLDPPAWTNFAHNASPTDIHNAQVPDPSWEWVWPEWRINRDECIDADPDGWEYSFMFSKKFSWHRPKWYNSFVRRRAWTRRRIKKGFGYQANDEHLMNPDYFTVSSKKRQRTTITSFEDLEQQQQEVGGASQDKSQGALDAILNDEEDDFQIPAKVKTAAELMPLLRRSRIDREKLEALENYIQNCTDDLRQLDDSMHEVLALFVFQASRKLLLSRLVRLHDEVAAAAAAAEGSRKGGEKPPSAVDNTKVENLAGAIRHADEEIRRLEFWSDIKDMAESGESAGAVDRSKGWGEGWDGLDMSGAPGVKEDELP